MKMCIHLPFLDDETRPFSEQESPDGSLSVLRAPHPQCHSVLFLCKFLYSEANTIKKKL